MAVVISHSFGFLVRLVTVPHIGRFVTLAVDHMQPLGVMGVELFFVLSGFLIGNILIKQFVTASDFSFSTISNFWVRRWFRTLPNYWLILTIDIILYQVMQLQNAGFHQIRYYFFLQNVWRPDKAGFFPEGWSLSIEEWFYLTLPVVMYLSARVAAPVNKGKFLWSVFVGYLSVFVLIRFFNAFHPINGDGEDEGIRKIVLFRLDAVMYGVLFAYFNYFKGSILNRYKGRLLTISLCGTVAILYLITKHDLAFTSSPNPAVRFVCNAFLYLFIPLFFSLCLPYANSVKKTGSALFSRLVVHISKISYSMYLVHYSLVFLPFFYPMKVGRAPGTVVVYYLLYWVIVVGLSSLLFRYFESPVMKLREKFASK